MGEINQGDDRARVSAELDRVAARRAAERRSFNDSWGWLFFCFGPFMRGKRGAK
jgi:hypothetical protein